jgi:hypothetical protein
MDGRIERCGIIRDRSAQQTSNIEIEEVAFWPKRGEERRVGWGWGCRKWNGNRKFCSHAATLSTTYVKKVISRFFLVG